MNVAGHHFLAHARLTGNEDFAATCAGAPGHLEDVPHGRAPADHTRRRDRLTCETGVHRLHATTESHGGNTQNAKRGREECRRRLSVSLPPAEVIAERHLQQSGVKIRLFRRARQELAASPGTPPRQSPCRLSARIRFRRRPGRTLRQAWYLCRFQLRRHERGFRAAVQTGRPNVNSEERMHMYDSYTECTGTSSRARFGRVSPQAIPHAPRTSAIYRTKGNRWDD